MAQFHTKAVSCFGKKQTAQGTRATIAAADALAITNLTYTPVLETTTDEYLGNPATRTAAVTTTDFYAKIEAETPISVNTPGVAPAYTAFLEACGVNGLAVADAPTATPPVAGSVTYSNNTINNTYITCQFRRRSPTITTEKTHSLMDVRGTLDINIELNKRPMFKFNLIGNVDNPTQEGIIDGSFGNQVNPSFLIPPLKQGNVNTSAVLFGGKQICLTKFSAQNFFGIDLQRYMFICGSGVQTDTLTAEYTVEYLEADVSSATITDELYAKGNTNVALDFTLGTVAGKKMRISIPNGTIKNIGYGAAGNFVTKVITVAITGLSTLTFQ